MPVFTEVAEEMEEELGEDGEGDKAELTPGAIALPPPPPPAPPPFLAAKPLVVVIVFCLPLGLTVALQVVLRVIAPFSGCCCCCCCCCCCFCRVAIESVDDEGFPPLDAAPACFFDTVPFSVLVDASLADVDVVPLVGVVVVVVAFPLVDKTWEVLFPAVDFSRKLEDRGLMGGGTTAVSPAAPLRDEGVTLD